MQYFSGVNVRTSDIHPICDNDNKERINILKGVSWGSCLVGHLTYISRGLKLGSGAIVENIIYSS